MATTTYYVFSAPGTEKLASLVSITQDLHGVLDLCQKFDDIKGKPFDETLWEALSTGIVVRYARCFSTGIRTSLPHSLMETASSEHRDLHRRFMAMRNMHVAHSVNELEETYVTVSVEYELDILSGQALISILSNELGRHSRKGILPKEYDQWFGTTLLSLLC